jgi:acetyltransferase-like isoleucine patch superfamily enzyme
MSLISKILRLVLEKNRKLFSILRILRLKLLYPGIEIDFETIIEGRCDVVCIKGGKLKIFNSKISFGSCIVADKGSEISIESSFIGRNCVITSKEKIEIRKNCLIAEMVVIRDQDHFFPRESENKSSDEKFITAPIEIGENVWIASKATILKGVTVGKNSVIGASAVVTSNVPESELWAGIPAKFLKKVTPG